MYALFIRRPSFCVCIFVSHVSRLNTGTFSTFNSGRVFALKWETESKAAVMLAHMRRQLEIMPHFTHRYQHFCEKKSLNKCNNEAQNGATNQPDLFFFLQPFPVLPPSANLSMACSLCSRSESRSHHPNLTPLFPPIRFSFPLNSLTLTHTRTSCTHTSLSYLWPWQPGSCPVVR